MWSLRDEFSHLTFYLYLLRYHLLLKSFLNLLNHKHFLMIETALLSLSYFKGCCLI